MRYFSAFTGVGGFDLAMPLDWVCVGHSEIDKYANMVLRYRFKGVRNYGDVEKIDWGEVADFDMLVGGTPCQDLSVAGKREGLNGSRSRLFFEFTRALKEKSHDISSGKTLRELYQAMGDGTLRECSLSFPRQGILSGGRFSTSRGSVSPA